MRGRVGGTRARSQQGRWCNRDARASAQAQAGGGGGQRREAPHPQKIPRQTRGTGTGREWRRIQSQKRRVPRRQMCLHARRAARARVKPGAGDYRSALQDCSCATAQHPSLPLCAAPRPHLRASLPRRLPARRPHQTRWTGCRLPVVGGVRITKCGWSLGRWQAGRQGQYRHSTCYTRSHCCLQHFCMRQLAQPCSVSRVCHKRSPRVSGSGRRLRLLRCSKAASRGRCRPPAWQRTGSWQRLRGFGMRLMADLRRGEGECKGEGRIRDQSYASRQAESAAYSCVNTPSAACNSSPATPGMAQAAKNDTPACDKRG